MRARKKCEGGEEREIEMQGEREKETFRRQRHHQSDRSWAVCVHLVVGHGTCVWGEVHFDDGCGISYLLSVVSLISYLLSLNSYLILSLTACFMQL